MVGSQHIIFLATLLTYNTLHLFLFIQSIISVWTQGYFILWVIIEYYFIFLLILFPALATGNSFIWLLGLFYVYPPVCLGFFVCLFFSISSLSGTMICSRSIMYIFCPSPRIRHFSKEPWFLLLENGIGI